jgi:DNA-binding PadR family transcriptional regulator
MTTQPSDLDAFLPLPPATFHILLALSAGDRHGYGIIQDVEERTGGDVRMSAGTLYRTIQRLLERGLISEPRKPLGVPPDPRRRYYRITTLGTEVARAETRRLARLVRLATGAGLPSAAS